MASKRDVALREIKARSGPVSMKELSEIGISRSTMKSLVDSGEVESLARGVFCSPSSVSSEYADWAVASFRIPGCVVCLLSAASRHRMTQEVPSSLSVAVPREATGKVTAGLGVPLDVLRWSNPAMFELGVDVLRTDGVDVLVTSPERTLVDLFRYSSLNPSMREASVRITDEMFLDSLERCHSGEIRLFSFESVSAIARELGCYRAMRPFTKTMRFRRADLPLY